MLRSVLLLVLGVQLSVGRCDAIEIAWSGGGRDITLSSAEASRCTLLVYSSSEQGLPEEWRLAWVAASVRSGLPFRVLADSVAGASAPCEVWGSRDAPEAKANMVTVNFCRASGSTNAKRAAYVLEVQPATSLKLRAYALVGDQDVDSSSVVTINGGMDAALQPVVLRAACGTDASGTSLLAVGAVGAT
jgi:hypothetical protein